MKGRLMILSHRIKGRLLKYKWYSWRWKPFNRTAVFVSDGRFFAGGLADRFKGMVSLYAWAKKKRVPFRIEHTVPFQLTQYLVPNEYDWISKDGDFVRTVWNADIVYAVREPNAISRMGRKARYKQAHFYGNRDLLPSMNIDSDKWGVLFKELFKPTGELQMSIDEARSIIGERYFFCGFPFSESFG